eukprot:Plantae.Rhodophyta-Rhodochaete_pulchella.ctg1921.p1 GENE.Plantae.Rhodophyta-Rhodochaete_pulchella.ctg1921~~Plantae.Rhodophyta-Rhodochaete_pulchella.ctg1921.p1  ORF type:complete len:444 (-),score=63.24 Plantae.Rhodophyta-Rhodochaete_pulchella.ctg1921:1441-2772(-)
MVYDPTGFWDRQHDMNPSGMSWTSLFGIYSLFVTNTQLIRKCFMNNAEDAFKVALHPNGVKILGDDTITFKMGEPHRVLRKSFATLFSRKSLGQYLAIQETTIRYHMDQWIRDYDAKFFEIRDPIRTMNLETSQDVFVGPYLDDSQGVCSRHLFSKNYVLMTKGFMTFPWSFPGNGLWKAIRARKALTATLREISHRSKQRMARGEAPLCLVDYWSQRIIEDLAACKESGETPPPHTSAQGMSDALIAFLFASQDASTGSLNWMLAFLSTWPDILERIRAEQKALRPNKEPLDYDIVERMVYTKAVVLEALRFRPPAPMVPMVTGGDVAFTDEYVIPKNTLVFPSLSAACREGFPNPHVFDPERMMPGRDEHIKYRENFLPFGVGPHYCPGREYAINHIIAFVAIFTTEIDWERNANDRSNDVAYIPTHYPHDVVVKLSRRAD